jgi:hypothetical protein
MTQSASAQQQATDGILPADSASGCDGDRACNGGVRECLFWARSGDFPAVAT